MKRGRKPGPKTHRVQVCVSITSLDALRERSVAERRSISAMAAILLADALAAAPEKTRETA